MSDDEYERHERSQLERGVMWLAIVCAVGLAIHSCIALDRAATFTELEQSQLEVGKEIARMEESTKRIIKTMDRLEQDMLSVRHAAAQSRSQIAWACGLP